LMFRFGDPQARALRLWGTVGLLSAMVLTPLGNPNWPFLLPFAPLVTVFAVGFFWSVADAQFPRRGAQHLLVGILVVLTAYPVVGSLLDRGSSSRSPSSLGLAIELSRLHQMTPPRTAIVTDEPTAVAWYAQRTAIWLPRAKGATWRTVKRLRRPDYVFLTGSIANYGPREQVREWADLYRGDASGFPEDQFEFLEVAPTRYVLLRLLPDQPRTDDTLLPSPEPD
jgi:hypothetical protein